MSAVEVLTPTEAVIAAARALVGPMRARLDARRFGARRYGDHNADREYQSIAFARALDALSEATQALDAAAPPAAADDETAR